LLIYKKEIEEMFAFHYAKKISEVKENIVSGQRKAHGKRPSQMGPNSNKTFSLRSKIIHSVFLRLILPFPFLLQKYVL